MYLYLYYSFYNSNLFPNTRSPYLLVYIAFNVLKIVAMLPARIYTVLSTFASILLLSLLLFMINLKAHAESGTSTVLTNELMPEGVTITQSLIDSAMPELNQTQLGKILTDYYNNCLGGAENWKTINSFKVSAELNTPNGIQTYVSIYKKPNFYKIAISSEETKNIVAFDGNNKCHFTFIIFQNLSINSQKLEV